ncbi:MAG: isocitrate/isopropylmalate family dehydrogenase, partial [Chloroflexota bacterium]|nr:isocitrate/isopropylmalate family dehydrogenase [Chloroflexota bacterium]
VHGAAFDIAGKGIANPLATISAVGLMLDHLGESDAARKVESAVMQSLEERKVVTGDLGGNATTKAVGDEVVRLMSGQ